MRVTGTGQWVVDTSLDNPAFAFPTALWEITGGTGFLVDLRIDFESPLARWQPCITGWNALHTFEATTPTTSLTAGWYWEDNAGPVVPEPATFAIWTVHGTMSLVAACHRQNRTLRS